MDLLLSCWALGESFAKSLPTVAPQCVALVMPAAQDAAFVGSLAWFVLGLDPCTASIIANVISPQDFVPHLADIQETG